MDDIAEAPLLRRHRIDVSVYYRMAEAGILHEDDRVELIDGEILDMVPIGSGHAGTVNRLHEGLIMAFGRRATISVQNPLRLDTFNEPEPDILVLQRREDFYEAGHPTASDVLLLVEVADSSLAYDRRVKVPLYARHAIAEVWLVDLNARVVEVFRDPAPDGYRSISRHGPGEIITPAAAPDVRIDVAVILGGATSEG